MERDGGDFLGSADSSVSQHYRTAFCALKYSRSSYKPAIYVALSSGSRRFFVCLVRGRLGLVCIVISNRYQPISLHTYRFNRKVSIDGDAKVLFER